MTGGDVPVAQLKLRQLGHTITVDGHFGPKTEEIVKKYQKSIGLKVDGIVGPRTWERLEAMTAPQKPVQPTKPAPVSVAPKPVKPAPAPTSRPEQSMNEPTWPSKAIKLYQDLGWSKTQAIALTANLMWESGGNSRYPPTIVFDAKGDRGKSHGAGQWNETAGRFGLLKDFAIKRGKEWTDPETQLLVLDHELHTTERKAGTLLKASETIEEAISACIKIWRPSIPHADRRLAIARKLMGG